MKKEYRAAYSGAATNLVNCRQSRRDLGRWYLNHTTGL